LHFAPFVAAFFRLFTVVVVTVVIVVVRLAFASRALQPAAICHAPSARHAAHIVVANAQLNLFGLRGALLALLKSVSWLLF